MSNKTIQYISVSKAIILERRENIMFSDINVFIKDPLPSEMSLTKTLRSVEKIVPKHLVSNIDTVYVGDFEHFRKRDINAAYMDGALYISNDQDSEVDMIDDIVHEIAHAVEEKYGTEIYGDGEIEREFLTKRKKLYDMLTAYGYNLNEVDFYNVEFNREFDDLLHQKIGYEKLEFFTMGLFLNNYSVTSLREYFAIAFEIMLLGNPKEVDSISPILYQKINMVLYPEENTIYGF
tara:strand:- start:169 stop:873 length:705 start_codon:yes stop_codon:yes gene_type:complete